MKKERYHDLLRSEVRQFMSISSFRTLDDMVARAIEREIDFGDGEEEEVGSGPEFIGFGQEAQGF